MTILKVLKRKGVITMNDPIHINVPFDLEFKKILVKMALIYKPNEYISFNREYQGTSDAIADMAHILAQDFAEQLEYEVYQSICKKVDKQINNTRGG